MITLKQAISDIVKEVEYTSKQQLGGPFGAFVFKTLFQEGEEEYIEIVAKGTNGVTTINDPTAHAEIMAIRNACANLNTYDLSGYSIYATGYPCPMCLGAIIWAGIKDIVFSQTLEDAHELGFKDKEMYENIFKNPDASEEVSIKRCTNSQLKDIYESYRKEGIIY